MVSVADVYFTVQTIINKENRGYITKEEFNRLATQAQLEIFEAYFGDKNRAQSLGDNSDDYSDIARNVEEKLTFFDNFINIEQTALGNRQGFAYPSGFYRVGIVTTAPTTGLPVVIDEVSHKDIAYINLSNLTAPTLTQPVYTRHEGGLIAYPSEVNEIGLNYVRRPNDPQLTGVVVNSQFVPGADSVNFELHPSEQQELVAKILTYAGVIIRQPEITQIGSQKEQQIKGTEG